MAIALSDKEFRLIRDFVYERFGINLTEQKRPLMAGRLQSVLQKLRLTSFKAYYDYLLQEPGGEGLTTLVNRISTNHTFFYREPAHFEFLQQEVLPKHMESAKRTGNKKLRIWCAGCSSGEEPYTLSMVLREYLRGELDSWDIGILATDISGRVLQIAQHGIYTEDSLSHLPKPYRQRYFKRTEAGSWAVVDSIKGMVVFRKFNLMRRTFPFNGKFDVIFCRNVMIYFDKATRSALVERFYKCTERGGYLFVGHSETLGRGECFYEYRKPATYRKEH